MENSRSKSVTLAAMVAVTTTLPIREIEAANGGAADSAVPESLKRMPTGH